MKERKTNKMRTAGNMIHTYIRITSNSFYQFIPKIHTLSNGVFFMFLTLWVSREHP